MRLKHYFFISLIVVLAAISVGLPTPSPLHAQSDNVCTNANDLALPATASGTITNDSYIFSWCFDGTRGQTVTVTVNATSGNLDPLIGLTNIDFDPVYIENDDISANDFDSSFTFTLPETRQYVIIVTRSGIQDGKTTGNFTLSVGLDGESPSTTTDSTTFEFPTIGDGTSSAGLEDAAIFIQCDTGERVRGAIQFSFIAVNPGFSYTATVLGIDGFDPVLVVETRPGIGTCNDDNPNVLGSRVDVPGYGNVFATTSSAQVRFTSPGRGNPINIIVGSFNDEPGRFVLIIEGLAISPSTELDGFSVRVPEDAQEEPLGVYMVARYTDLDPYMYIAAGEGLNAAYSPDGEFFPDLIDYNRVFGPLYECDDASVAPCDFSPNFENGNILISNGSSYNPGRVDAGLMLIPYTTDPILYVLGSLNGASSGTYAILVTGYVPGP
ncbi:MAG: hypothetical protein CUN55_02120 [Phototrophicales bacterium]|nr:MAG: hypothetical protein CUN55_02120 [Phototrophicales bacterium]